MSLVLKRRLFFTILCLGFFIYPADPVNADTIQGIISERATGREGLRIMAFRETTIGFRFGTRPCRIASPQTQTIGETMTDSEGSYIINYVGIAQPPGSCSFKSIVYIRVYEGSTLLWTSPPQPARARVIISHDLSEGRPPDCTNISDTNPITLYLAPYGYDANSGISINEPVRTFARIHELIDVSLNRNYIVNVRGGMYYGETIRWRKTSPDHCILITAYGNEKPIFEGVGHSVFIDLRSDSGNCTNMTINGLTIRHYVNYGIRFYGDLENRAGWNGCNVISNNTFEENGDLHTKSYCIGCVGYGAIDLVNSDRNIIRDNVFIDSEDVEEDASHMHAVYIAHNSSENEIYGNYIKSCSGDPFRVRDASNDNYIHDNYVVNAGKYGFISGYSNTENNEQTSNGNRIKDNIVTFPYRLFDSVSLIHNSGPTDASTYTDEGQTFYRGAWPNQENIGAIASGDFDGDGQSELVVAFNYRDFTKVVRTTGGSDRHLQKLIYLRTEYEVLGFATGDFDGSGTDQILTYFRNRSNGRTDIYRGNGRTSLTNHGRIYNSSRWKVTAMTAGDFDGDDISESMVALHDGNETRIYRGNGTSSILVHDSIYVSTHWTVPAMTAGDFDGDSRDELVSAFQSNSETRIYRGNGITSALNLSSFYSSSVWNITALAAGYYCRPTQYTCDTNTPGLITAFQKRSGNESRLYQGNGRTSATNIRFYVSDRWRVAGLAAGQFDNRNDEEIITAFTWPTRNQIFVGNGYKYATILSRTHRNIFHRWNK